MKCASPGCQPGVTVAARSVAERVEDVHHRGGQRLEGDDEADEREEDEEGGAEHRDEGEGRRRRDARPAAAAGGEPLAVVRDGLDVPGSPRSR